MPTALVTGASRGLGRALARSLAEIGWDLVVDARTPGPLEATAADLRSRGPGTVTALAGDVTDPDHRARLVGAIPRGRLRLLVNNASALGASPLPRVAGLDPATFARILDVNLAAPHALFVACLPTLLADGGILVNISSDAAVEAYEGWGGYGASKAGLDHLTRTAAAEHPELSVYAFDPGDMRTQMHQQAFPGEDISDRPPPEDVVPALLGLIAGRPASGRYRAADLLARAGGIVA